MTEFEGPSWTERNEYRRKCGEAIRSSQVYISPQDAIKALDSLHGIVRVVQIEAIEDLFEVIKYLIHICKYGEDQEGQLNVTIDELQDAIHVVAVAGDLTNPPEGK